MSGRLSQPAARSEDRLWNAHHGEQLPATASSRCSAGARWARFRRTDISTFVVDLTHAQLATATVVTTYRILAMTLRSAVHDRLLVASPCYKIRLPGMPPRRLQAFTADEVDALLEHAASRD